MYKSNKIKVGFLTPLNLGIIISILTTIILYMVPLNNATTKFIIALLIGTSIGFLISMIIYLYRRLNRLAIHDELTGLYNVNFLNECKFRVITQTDRQQSKMGVVLVDIYCLKDIVGSYGRKVGEEVLKYVGEGLSTTSRASEFVFRLESDDFLIFFTDISDYSNIKIIKSRLEMFFQKPLIYNDIIIDVKLNFGYAVYPEDGENFEKVLNVAQQRMYIEKADNK